MPRTTPAAVLELRPSARDPLPFILTAGLLVDTHLATAGLSAALLEEIEKYWAAHLMEIGERTVIRTQLGDSSFTLESVKLGEGLKSTLYGQTVLLLDPTGVLTTTGLRRVVFDAF